MISLKAARVAMVLALFACGLVSVGRAEAQGAVSGFATVARRQFQPGNYWRWTYSSLDKKTGAWEPYFVETYTVVAEAGSVLTIEMSSTPTPFKPTPAHHKLVIDFASCEKALDPRFAQFKVAFYTKSLGNGWQVVSLSHPNLVFTEKFNCAGPRAPIESIAASAVDFAGARQATFRFETKQKKEASWYFLDLAGLEGVQAMKLFEPALDYKSELSESCDRGTACGAPPR